MNAVLCCLTTLVIPLRSSSLLTSRNDTVRYALDVLAILTVVPKIQLQLAEPVDVLDEAGSTVSTVGKLNIVLVTYSYQLASGMCLLQMFLICGETRVKIIHVLRAIVRDANKWESRLS